LLDVGCGFGHFVQWAVEHGWDAWGIEPDPWARESSVVPRRVVKDAASLEGSFDVVSMWDVLEHTTDPIGLAASLRGLVCPGGRLFVCSPNFAAMKLRWPVLRHSPERFSQIVKPDEHAVQFTELGARLTLQRAGYERVEVLRPPLANRPNPVLDALVRWWPSLRQGLFLNAYPSSDVVSAP
jgi:SAM-dependent methyltransferase